MNVPGGKSTVTPYVAVRNASGFLDFVARVFGAAEVGRVSNPDGSIGHAETVIGNAVIMVFDAPKSWPETPAFLSVYLEDADEAVARAVDASAVLITQVATSGIVGDRGGRVKDPEGNIWWIQTHLEDIDEATMMERFADPTELAIMEDAQRTLDTEMRSRTHERVFTTAINGDASQEGIHPAGAAAAYVLGQVAGSGHAAFRSWRIHRPFRG